MSWLTKFNNWRLRRARTRAYKKASRDFSSWLAGEFSKRYAAARPSRLEHHSLGWMRDYNSLIEAANPRLRERVRGLTRNFPPFVRAINAQAAFVVGKGARFQSLVTDDDGQADIKTRKKIEDRFRRWMEKASIDGRLHFYDCQRLALRQRLECGEFFFCFRSPKNPGRHPLALQFIEPDRVQGGLDVTPARPDSVVWQGIEFDHETGERFAYHVLKEQFPPRYQWGYDTVADDRMVHGYDVLRPGQLRGVTVFAPAIILADSMSDYMDAELDAAKMAAKWLAIVTMPQPEGLFGETGAGRNPLGPGPAPAGPPLEEIENCVINYLRTGEDIKIVGASGRVNDGFDRFTSFVLRMISITAGPPYEVLSGDYSGVNYSTARMSRQDYNMFLEPERFWLEHAVNRPVFREWLRVEALTQNYLPGYFKDPAHYEKAMWVPAGMPSPDPLREGKADIDNLKGGLDSPQNIILSRGGDPEQVLEELAEWQRLQKEKGVAVNINAVSTAMQTNPDKLDELGDNDLASFEEDQ
ncbi:phage portal protein [Deltaproteobacteria bacterium OttesenSCG-928-M10]|nr:phage portal protein [Deltaproteobacteria bacterium OttesenSCG-928-M10]